MVSRLIMDHMDPNEAIVITVREGGRRERKREREGGREKWGDRNGGGKRREKRWWRGEKERGKEGGMWR